MPRLQYSEAEATKKHDGFMERHKRTKTAYDKLKPFLAAWSYADGTIYIKWMPSLERGYRRITFAEFYEHYKIGI